MDKKLSKRIAKGVGVGAVVVGSALAFTGCVNEEEQNHRRSAIIREHEDAKWREASQQREQEIIKFAEAFFKENPNATVEQLMTNAMSFLAGNGTVTGFHADLIKCLEEGKIKEFRTWHVIPESAPRGQGERFSSVHNDSVLDDLHLVSDDMNVAGFTMSNRNVAARPHLHDVRSVSFSPLRVNGIDVEYVNARHARGTNTTKIQEYLDNHARSVRFNRSGGIERD